MPDVPDLSVKKPTVIFHGAHSTVTMLSYQEVARMVAGALQQGFPFIEVPRIADNATIAVGAISGFRPKED